MEIEERLDVFHSGVTVWYVPRASEPPERPGRTTCCNAVHPCAARSYSQEETSHLHFAPLSLTQDKKAAAPRFGEAESLRLLIFEFSAQTITQRTRHLLRYLLMNLSVH